MNFTAFQKLFYYQLLVSLRSKESVFFAIFLPALLFIIFGYSFGINSDYAKFFLPGMIGSVFAADALYAVGPVIKNYYSMNIVRYYKNYPVNISYLFLGFIITRLIFIVFSSLILILLSGILFYYIPSLNEFLRYLIGIFLGFSIYSFIALTISLYGIQDNKDQGILSIIYFLTIFLTDAFFVISKANLTFDLIGYVFPLKVILIFMRGDDSFFMYSLAWLTLSYLIFHFRINKIQLKRI